MNSTFNRSSRKNIASTFGRYLSLIVVSFLGAGILAGLLAIAPDMQKTADDYFQDQNIADVKIQSPLGFSQTDLSKIAGQKEVAESAANTTFDGIADIAGSSYTMRIQSIPEKQGNEKQGKLNQLKLVKGRLPKASGEAVIVAPPDGLKKIQLDDNAEFTKKDTESYTTANQFKVVGVVKSGLYPHNKQGTTSVGSGTIDFVLFASAKSFKTDTSNNVYVKFKNTTKLNSFSEKYGDLVNRDIQKLKNLSKIQAKLRYQDFQEQITTAENKITENEVQVELAKKMMPAVSDQQMQVLENEIAQAKAELGERKNELKKIKHPQWYFEPRSQNQGFAIIKSDAQSMKSLATIFPVIFFLVAVLVSLTSMTRMIDDERTLIGTFKALGYSNGKIASRYLIYSISATLIGSVLGVIAGFQGLPRIIWSAYSTQYSLPDIQLGFLSNYALLAILTMLLITTLVTGWMIFKTLREAAAELLVPKAQPVGKQIFLEKISFIWKHLSFSQKVTQRNIFLDKKRMLMTVIGVIGSTALLVTGFALQNSATNFPKEQYQHITKYDATANFDETSRLSSSLKNDLADNEAIGNYLSIHSESLQVSSVHSGTKDYYINLVVPEQADQLSKFVMLDNHESKVSIKKAGVVITKNIADRLKLKVGDKFSGKLLTDYDSETMKITGIVDNYHLNYLYMDKAYYTEIFKKESKLNQLLIKGENKIDPQKLEKAVTITHVELTRTTMDRLANNMKSINMVVVILIVLASMLSIVVLYNVTNINIEERQREIATIKVLGFTDREAYAYVFRETMELSLLGTAVGLIGGAVLFQQVIQSFGTEYYIFDTTMSVMTFVFAALFSLLFAGIINLLMMSKIKRIDMLESLKSVE